MKIFIDEMDFFIFIPTKCWLVVDIVPFISTFDEEMKIKEKCIYLMLS